MSRIDFDTEKTLFESPPLDLLLTVVMDRRH